MNAADIILIILLAIVIAAAGVKTFRDLKSGKCCGECSRCGGCKCKNDKGLK